MDYSALVKAVQENDDKTVSSILKTVNVILYRYLRVRFNSSHHDAEDCVQNTLMLVFEKCKNDAVESPDAILSYMFTTARNEYFKRLEKSTEINMADLPDSYAKKPDQLENLLDEEQLSILEECLGLLKETHRNYIEYWINHPAEEASAVAKKFNISVSNAWTRKHRILKQLNKCYEDKINL